MWSFGHLAVLCFIIGFVVYFMVENRVRRLFDEEKKTEQEETQRCFLLLCFLICSFYLYLYLPIASSSAVASWSGQLVPFEPHSMPLRRAITSSAFWPLINELMPCRLPWQPPAKATLPIVLSSLSSMSIRRLHVPLVV